MVRDCSLGLGEAASGVAKPEIYSQVASREVIPGIFSQDLLTIVLSTIVLLFAFGKSEDLKTQGIVTGVMGYFFYGYAIYVIEQLYTVLYFLYMAIFGLSFYSIIFSVLNLKRTVPKVMPSKTIRILSISFLTITPLIFYPLWISQIIPLIQTRQKLEFLYPIYILDLCFIMPLFVMAAVKTAKNAEEGPILTPSTLYSGFHCSCPSSI